MNIDELKNKLCRGQHSSLSISWNDDNGPNYQSVAEAVEDGAMGYYRNENFISMDERQKCINTNSIWTAQWYPITPVGFCVRHAATFEALVAALQDAVRHSCDI